MIIETGRIKNTASWLSCGAFVEREPAMEWLNSKCQQYALTLSCVYRGERDTYGENGTNFDRFDIIDRLRLLDYEGCTYWHILHDEDKYTEKDAPSPEEVGKLKGAHVHLVIDFHREVRAYTCLRLVCRLFGLNPDQNENPAESPDIPVFVELEDARIVLNPWLSIKPLHNLMGMLPYIVHETREAKEAGKTHYDHILVCTNDRETFESACTLNEKGILNLTPSNLIHIVRVCDYKTAKILNLLGIKDYLAMRMIIRDLISERS